MWLFGSAGLTLAGCATPPQRTDQADERNRASLYSLPLDLFGRPETGWAVYAPRIALTIGASTAADTPAFADAVARWRRGHRLGAGGEVDAALLTAMKQQWQDERPFVRLRATGVCPAPPAAEDLATLDVATVSAGARCSSSAVRWRRTGAWWRTSGGARRCWRRGRTCCKSSPPIAAPSGMRRAARRSRTARAWCARPARPTARDWRSTSCSTPHQARLSTVRRTPTGWRWCGGLAYRSLLANAPRFGFVNYAFEPWHWEWSGQLGDGAT